MQGLWCSCTGKPSSVLYAGHCHVMMCVRSGFRVATRGAVPLLRGMIGLRAWHNKGTSSSKSSSSLLLDQAWQ